jgi:hypothetical protein
MEFDGTSARDKVELAATDLLAEDMTELSFCFWEATAGTGDGIVTLSNSVHSQAFALYTRIDGTLAATINGVASDDVLTPALSTGSWHHICVSWASATGNLDLYYDKFKTSFPGYSTSPILKAGSTFVMGQLASEGVEWAYLGYLSSASMWQYLVTQEQVNKMYVDNILPASPAINYCDMVTSIQGSVSFIDQSSAGLCSDSVLKWFDQATTNLIEVTVKDVFPTCSPVTDCSVTSWTLGMWAKVDGGTGRSLFSWATSSQPNAFTVVYYDDRTIFAQNNEYFGEAAAISLAINNNVWVHLTFVWDIDSGLDVYRNGAFHSNLPRHIGEDMYSDAEGILSFGQEPDKLGGGYDIRQAFFGSMTRLYAYGRKFDASEVLDLYMHYEPDDWVFAFDNCQVSSPIQGKIKFASREEEAFTGTP